MAMGYQENNFSPMGQGQPDRNKNGPRRAKNYMDDIMPAQEQLLESVAPGVPPPTSSTMPVGQRVQQPVNQPPVVPQNQPVGIPQSFSGQGQGWRGLDLNAVSPTGANRFTGFNTDRAFAGGDPNSTKDAFARWAAGFDTNLGGLDKSDNGALEQALRNRLDLARQMGLNIQDIQGDKILIDSYENPGQFNWVDIMKNAGADGEFAWQPENIPGVAPANQVYEAYQNQLVAPEQNSGIEDLLIALMQQNQEMV